MKIHTRLRKSITPLHFVRSLTLIAALWLLVIYPYLSWNHPESLPKNAVPGKESNLPLDFDQYYLGAFLARNGLWDNLYPIPKSDIYEKPTTFRPKVTSFLFNESKAAKNPIYYPTLAYSHVGEYPDKIGALLPEVRTYKHTYYYPPPMAMILSPLANFDSKTAAYKIWPTICIISMFGTCFFSSRIYRVLAGSPSYSEGFIIAVFLLFTVGGCTTINYGNITPILGCLVAFCAYAWIRGWQISCGLSMIPLLIFKGIGLNWCPLLLIGKIKWSQLIAMAIASILVNLATLHYAGVDCYKIFLRDILPKISVPVGDGLVARIFTTFGFYPKTFYSFITISLLFLVYFLYRKRNKDSNTTKLPTVSLAALAATLVIFCLFGFSFHSNYLYNYVYFPFLGWLLWEYRNSSGHWRHLILIALLSGATWLPETVFSLNEEWQITQTNATFLIAMKLLVRAGIIVSLFSILAVALRRLGSAVVPENPNSESDTPTALPVVATTS